MTANDIEKILFRRALEHKLEGYTKETAEEIAGLQETPKSANRALSFDEMMNRVAVILEGTPDAHARAEKIVVALFGEPERVTGQQHNTVE